MSDNNEVKLDGPQLTYPECLEASESLELREAAQREQSRSKKFDCSQLESRIALLRSDIDVRKRRIEQLESQQRQDGVDRTKLIGIEHNDIDRIRRDILPELEVELKVNRRAQKESVRVSRELFEESAAIRSRLGLELIAEECEALVCIELRRKELERNPFGKILAAIFCPRTS